MSDQWLADSSRAGFAPAVRTLRWRGAGQVELTAFSGWLGETLGTATLSLPTPTRSEPADGFSAEPPPVVGAVVEDMPRPRIVAEGRGADAPEGKNSPHWIQGGARSFFGDFEPFGCEQCLDAMVDTSAGSPEWNRWWESASRPGVDLLVRILAVDDEHWQQLLPRALRAAEAVTARR